MMMNVTEPRRLESTSAASPVGLRLFVLVVVLAASLALAMLSTVHLPGRFDLLLLFVGLGAVAGVRPIHFSGLRIEMTATHVVVLVALGALGPLAAALVGVAGVIAAALGRDRLPAPIRFVFNLGAVTLSTAAAAGIFWAAGGSPGQTVGSAILPLAAASVAFFVANTGLLSAVIAIEKRQHYVQTWMRSFSWSPVAYLCGLCVAVAVLAAIDNIALWTLVFVLPICRLLKSSYRDRAADIAARTTGAKRGSSPARALSRARSRGTARA